MQGAIQHAEASHAGDLHGTHMLWGCTVAQHPALYHPPDTMLLCRLFNSAAERVMCRLRCKLFSRLMGQETGFFDRTRTGELMNRLSEVRRVLLWQCSRTSMHRVALGECCAMPVSFKGC